MTGECCWSAFVLGVSITLGLKMLYQAFKRGFQGE